MLNNLFLLKWGHNRYYKIFVKKAQSNDCLKQNCYKTVWKDFFLQIDFNMQNTIVISLLFRQINVLTRISESVNTLSFYTKVMLDLYCQKKNATFTVEFLNEYLIILSFIRSKFSLKINYKLLLIIIDILRQFLKHLTIWHNSWISGCLCFT